MRPARLTGRPKDRCASVSFRATHQGDLVKICRRLSQVPGNLEEMALAGAGVAVDGPGRGGVDRPGFRSRGAAFRKAAGRRRTPGSVTTAEREASCFVLECTLCTAHQAASLGSDFKSVLVPYVCREEMRVRPITSG